MKLSNASDALSESFRQSFLIISFSGQTSFRIANLKSAFQRSKRERLRSSGSPEKFLVEDTGLYPPFLCAAVLYCLLVQAGYIKLQLRPLLPRSWALE